MPGKNREKTGEKPGKNRDGSEEKPRKNRPNSWMLVEISKRLLSYARLYSEWLLTTSPIHRQI